MARPTKLTTEIAGRICHHTRTGNYADTAAAFVGIHRSTFHDWLKYGAGLLAADQYRTRVEYLRWSEHIQQWLVHLAWSPQSPNAGPQPPAPATILRPQGDGAWVAFSDAVEKAVAEGEIRDMAQIGVHGRKEWQALAWRLERRQPDRYGRRARLELSGPGEEPIPVQAALSQVVFHIPVNGRERVPPKNVTRKPWPGPLGARRVPPAPTPPRGKIVAPRAG